MSSLEAEAQSPHPPAARRKGGAPGSSFRAVVTAYAAGCAVLMVLITVFLLPKNGFQLFASAGYHQMLLKGLEVMGLAFFTTLVWAFMSRRPQRR